MADALVRTGAGELERNKAVVRMALEAADRGDLDAVRECFAPGYVDHSRGTGSRDAHDRDGAMRAFEELASAFEGLRHTILDLIAEGDKVVLRVRATASHTQSLRNIPATEREVGMTQTVIYRLRYGKIAERWVDGVESVADVLLRSTLPVEDRPDGGSVRLVHSASAGWRPDPSGGEYWELGLEDVSLTYFRLEPGVTFPSHVHAAEQITLVLEGRLTFELDEARYELGPGDAIAIPSGLRHAVTAGDRPVLAVDAWSPPPEHLGTPGGD